MIGNQDANKNFSEATYKCIRCGAKIELPDESFHEIVGFCRACGRDTIFERIETKYVKAKYFENGKFIPERLAHDILINHRFVTFTDTDELYIYEGGVYKENGEAAIKKICEEVLKEAASVHRVNEVIEHIKRRTLRERSEADPFLLCVDNGILDLRDIKNGKVQLLPHTPDIIFFSKLPVSYDPKADCQKIKKFISEIVRGKDTPLIQEMVGYCLWRRYDIEKAFMLVGDGANGKSTFLELLIKLLGKRNVASIPLQELEINRFAKSELYGKLANIYADLPDRSLTHTGIFKMLTGGDIISAEKKFKNFFKFVNHAKLIFSCNKIPEVRDDSDAFYRRWVIITFPYKFDGENANPQILEEIATPDEMSGFLNWALEGLARLLKNKKFSCSETTEEMREKYILASNPVLAFVERCIDVDSESHIEKDLLYNAFCNFCKDVGLPIKAKNVFARELPQYVSISVGRIKEGDERKNVWYGIRLNEEGEKYLRSDKTERREDNNDVKDGRDFLYSNYKNNDNSSNKIIKNPDIPDNPANSTTTHLTKEDAEWAEWALKLRRGMPRDFFINLFIEKRGEKNKEEIGKLYDEIVEKLKKEGFWKSKGDDENALYHWM